MKANVKRVSLLLALVMIMFTFAACGGGETAAPTAVPGEDGTLSADKTDKLNVYLIATYVDENGLDSLKSFISDTLGDDVTIHYDTTFTGDGSDPSVQMAGMMKLTAAIAAKEVDLIIADDTNAARNARSEAFYDDEGNASGEKTPVCGVDITGDEVITPAMSSSSAGAFVAGNAANLENAKTVLKALAARAQAE